MNIQVRYEADPNSELITKEERYSQRLKWYESMVSLAEGASQNSPTGLQKALNWLLRSFGVHSEESSGNAPVPPPPDLNDPDYDTERGIFTFALSELQALMELAERNAAHLQVGPFVGPIRPDWEKEWPFTPAEYYARVLSELSATQSSAQFNWKLFDPVYSPDGWEQNGIARLVAWLLEQGQGDCWCKVCQQEYRAVELGIYDWEGNEIEGSLYLCPKDHALLRTSHRYLGEFRLFWEERRTKRERRPNPTAQEDD